MQTISAVYAYTLKEHLRHKAWHSAALFGLVLLGGALIVSALAADERSRLLQALGQAVSGGRLPRCHGSSDTDADGSGSSVG